MSIILLPHQEQFLKTVVSYLDRNFFIIVKGVSGCGKSHSFKWLQNNSSFYKFDEVLLLDNDNSNEDAYFPFKKACLSQQSVMNQELKKGIEETTKKIPLLGNILGSVVHTKINRATLDFDILNKDEQIIIDHLKKRVYNKKSCIICDNIHLWDRRSLQFLRQILNLNIIRGNEYQQVKFVLSITENQESANSDIINNMLYSVNSELIINFPKFDNKNFEEQLRLETGHMLSESQVKLLYNLVNGHLKVFFEVIAEIKHNSFDFNSKYADNKTYFNKLLDKRLKEFGATGPQIAEVLEYASIIGITFDSFELEKLKDYTKANMKKIINESVTLQLTEHTQKEEHYKFVHDIIREVFKTRVETNHVDYYHTIALCLKEIKPGQYSRRVDYMLRSYNNEQAAVLYCLAYIAQLRIYGDVSDTLQNLENLLNPIQKEYLFHMQQAYTEFHKKNYDSALTHLNSILSQQHELVAERDILKLHCFSKKLATEKTVAEIQMLDKKREDKAFNGEKEVQERYSHALISAFAHLGEIQKAKEIEEEVIKSLELRCNFDEVALTRVYAIKRNANAIHEIDVSSIHVNAAVNFFREQYLKGEYWNMIPYYSSMINHSAVLIKQGKFSDAIVQIEEAIKLEQDNSNISFPRTQILKSNHILAKVLDKKMSAKEATMLYNDIISGLTGVMAEKLFYTSNQSIMYALNNQLNDAFQILHNESLKHNIENDLEGLYRYRVVTNCSIYQYLLGNQTQAIENLEKIDSLLGKLINGYYFKKKNEILLKIMRSKIEYSGSEWLHSVHNECPTFLRVPTQKDPWRYFGLGFAFAALCDWGI